MTLSAVGFGRGFPRSWLLPIIALILLLGIAVTGGLSRSIVADLIAWWPVWIGLGLAAFFLRERKVGPVRIAGLIPLVAFACVLLFLWGHLAGWPIMPSASQRLVGPPASGIAEVSMTAGIDGEIDISGGEEEFLYRVEPIKHGGVIGIPTATEETAEQSLTVTLEAPEDPGLYGYAGWRILLTDTAAWDLRLAGAVDADLTGLQVDGLSLDGAGVATLGATAAETPVAVLGDFRVQVPADAAVRVIGAASVPSDWTLTDDGAVSPALGDGWVLTVVGDGTLTVSTG